MQSPQTREFSTKFPCHGLATDYTKKLTTCPHHTSDRTNHHNTPAAIMKFLKVGRVAIITRGRYAGKKVRFPRIPSFIWTWSMSERLRIEGHD
jgi:hypothetical protein